MSLRPWESTALRFTAIALVTIAFGLFLVIAFSALTFD
jgi:hypothetical protein